MTSFRIFAKVSPSSQRNAPTSKGAWHLRQSSIAFSRMLRIWHLLQRIPRGAWAYLLLDRRIPIRVLGSLARQVLVQQDCQMVLESVTTCLQAWQQLSRP